MTLTVLRHMPLVGFGTCGRRGKAGVAGILDALSLGYRHIDTGQALRTEGEAGAALDRSGLGREAVFVTTRICPWNLRNRREISSFAKSLERLGVDAVDLVLIDAGLSQIRPLSLGHSLEALAMIAENGGARRIGVANFTNAQVEFAERALGAGRIYAHAMDADIYEPKPAREARCRAAGIRMISTRPLAGGKIAADHLLTKIGKKYNATAAQVALTALMARGHAVSVCSDVSAHRAENLNATEIALDPLDLLLISALERRTDVSSASPPKASLDLARALI